MITLGNIIETSKKMLNKNPRIVEIDSGNINVRNVSNKKAKELLGWKPEVDLKTGLIALETIATN